MSGRHSDAESGPARRSPAATGPVRRVGIRDGAERSLLLVIVSFAVAVIGIRWFLQATGYPQVGGGELHIAHMLWGGLLVVAAAVLLLVVSAPWVSSIAAIATGAGTGLFIDEVGKFITSSNDYFYPLAAPLIYGILLTLVLLFIVIRRRPSSSPAVERPASIGTWEAAHLPRRRYRRLLIVGLLFLGVTWVLSWALFVSLDDATLRALIDQVVRVPGDRVERPDDPLFYGLEAVTLGLSGAVLIGAALLLARGRDATGSAVGIVGLGVALTAGALVSLYVEQVTAILSTIVNGALLFAIVHYRRRFVAS